MSARPPAVPPPPPFTVIRQADGSTAVSPPAYAGSALLAGQEMLQVDLGVTWPGFSRARARAQTTLISPWGISK